MESVSSLVKIHIPNYLSNLPIPASIGGWFKLSVKDWVSLVPFFTVVGGISYLTYRTIKPKQVINLSIEKENPKVAHIGNIEDLGDSTAYCRCWRSSKFPLCDGSHSKHNAEHGDNVGPIVIKKK
uniref:Putative conserved plasma membrane protein n=1 Tax=Rhodnius neglectus TaxID=72488 RepID=A0A0P4VKB0_9HEMI